MNRADAHGTVKDIVWVVLALYFLQEGIQAPVVKLRPERIAQHVSVWIVHVAPLIPRSEGRALVSIWNVRAGIDGGVQIIHEFQMESIIFLIVPITLPLQLQD